MDGWATHSDIRIGFGVGCFFFRLPFEKKKTARAAQEPTPNLNLRAARRGAAAYCGGGWNLAASFEVAFV